jgi:hypothetical protein
MEASRPQRRVRAVVLPGPMDAEEIAKATGVPLFEKKEDNLLQSPKILPAVQNIIVSVFEVNFDTEWKRLHDNLVLGNERTDHGSVVRHLDFAEDNARAAHKLWVCIRVEYERFEIDQKVLQAGMRNAAHAELQAEKDAKTRTKQITDEDVLTKMAELFPDEYRATELEKIKFRKTVEHAEAFSKVWFGKCETLRAILRGMRGGGG